MAHKIAAGNLHAALLLLYFCLPNVTFTLILALRLPQWTKFSFLACYLYAGTCVSEFRSGHVWIDYSMGATLGLFCFNCLHLTIVDPLQRYRHKSDDPVIGPNKLSWTGRVYWAWCTSTSVRDIGWNYISTPAHTIRSKFAPNTLAKLLYCVFLVDFLQTILEIAPFLQNTAADFSIRINFEYYAFALPCVATRLNLPMDWPAPFGHWADAYSIKNFWSRTWHSFVRRLCVSPGNKLTQILGAPSKTLPAAYIQLYATFIISATMHPLGDYMVGWQCLGASIPFFLVQPVGITIEEGFSVQSEPLSTARRLPLKFLVCLMLCQSELQIRIISVGWNFRELEPVNSVVVKAEPGSLYRRRRVPSAKGSVWKLHIVVDVIRTFGTQDSGPHLGPCKPNSESLMLETVRAYDDSLADNVLSVLP
ncbi:membrane bound O-acyl transferase family-domain-containing protein [Rhodocollybia butyracea]|uniref:Membrane bound O-acyl transferase family-domain-containing protein n=1 Tax=Rhodocollybia butyracea TaxID=206335 RepID=A0A9P5PP73_9AGAR|nr:membrane bound O-acyl transferase family-domain-containing protein [Rhodocollybia butyracea]